MRIVFGWELGAGMGHVSPHRRLLAELAARGHDVQVIARDVARAELAYAGLDFPIFQAPLALSKPDPVFHPTATMAQVLHNAGLNESDAVLARTHAWDRLLDWMRPDLVLMDYAPTLQLALRGRPISAVIFATGYFVPPPVIPVPVFYTMRGRLPAHVTSTEEATLDVCNRVLDARGQPPLNGLSSLWHDACLPILKTYPELDHYPERQGGTYVGSPPSPRGIRPKWPSGPGPRIYAYLKPYQTIGDLLEVLTRTGHPTLVAGDGLPDSLIKAHQSDTLHFEKGAIDLYETFETAALAITNGNHGTTAHALLCGVPVLCVPLHLEQSILAARVQEHGAGLITLAQVATGIGEKVERLLGETHFAEQARAFATRQSAFAMEHHLELVFAALGRVAKL